MYNTEKEFSKVAHFLQFPSNIVALPLLEMLATKVDLPSSCLFFTSLKFLQTAPPPSQVVRFPFSRPIAAASLLADDAVEDVSFLFLFHG